MSTAPLVHLTHTAVVSVSLNPGLFAEGPVASFHVGRVAGPRACPRSPVTAVCLLSLPLAFVRAAEVFLSLLGASVLSYQELNSILAQGTAYSSKKYRPHAGLWLLKGHQHEAWEWRENQLTTY